MKKLRVIVPLFFLLLMVACQKDIPEPQTKDTSFQSTKAVQASMNELANIDPFFVSHQVKGRDVYIECRIKDVSFRNNGTFMVLSIDGKKTKEIRNAAFIVKGLQSGTHQLKLELMKQNEHTVTTTKEFKVMIP
jgi:hypothetical protein